MPISSFFRKFSKDYKGAKKSSLGNALESNNEVDFSKTKNTLDDISVHAALTKYSRYVDRQSRLKASLFDTMTNNDSLTYFLFYAQSKNICDLVQFWLDVNALKMALVCKKQTPLTSQHPSTNDHIKECIRPHNDICASGAGSSCSSGYGSESTVAADYNKDIENKVVLIFTKYLSGDQSHRLDVPSKLREAVATQIDRHENLCDIASSCFDDCQKYVFNLLESIHYPSYTDSPYHLRQQLDLLTSHNLSIIDLIYHQTALSYFTEFMDSSGDLDYLQCFLDIDNYHKYYHDLASHYTTIDKTIHSDLNNNTGLSKEVSRRRDSTSNNNMYQGRSSYTGSLSNVFCNGNVAETKGNLAQEDAMIIYNKFFSMQAERPLNLMHGLRLELEESICKEGGPSWDCFDLLRALLLHKMETVHLPLFLKSNTYHKYLMELINCVQNFNFITDSHRPRKVSESGSLKSINSLLAVDTFRLKTSQSTLGFTEQKQNKQLSPTPKNELKLGHVTKLGQFIPDYEPDPDFDKKTGIFFKRSKRKEEEEEEEAARKAEEILRDVQMITNSTWDEEEEEEEEEDDDVNNDEIQDS